MTDRSKLLALADAVEKLSGPDRETDCRIWAATGGLGVPFEDAAMCVPDFGQWIAPDYTASLDAAMTLVPECWETEALGQGYGSTSRGKWHCVLYTRNAGLGRRSSTADPFTGSHDTATPALALCAAALRAQAEALS